MKESEFYALRNNLRTLRDLLPRLRAETMGLPDVSPDLPWRERLLHNVLPALDFDLPVLLVAICGGGSTGKSTLFNLLAGQKLSKVAFKAGLTSRVLLAGHPSNLSQVAVAESLLHRLPERPVAWRNAEDTTEPGPPLYATSDSIPLTLLLIDTPDFDTGDGGHLVNRQRAQPILQTAEVIVYIFTNTVYNNLSNTRFMADVVGGIGGRPTILVYRISRAASDKVVLEHCLTVARNLFGVPGSEDAFPEQVIGIYRTHESDGVAEGNVEPALIPLSAVTGGKALSDLLADLDVAAIKRHVFAADLKSIHEGASSDLIALQYKACQVALYRQTLGHAMAEQALVALKAFPVNEAIGVVTRLFLETSPTYVRVLRGTGRVVGAPLRGIQALGRKVNRLLGNASEPAPTQDMQATLAQDLLLSANELRNRLMDDSLIVRVTEDEALLREARQSRDDGGSQPLLLIEPLGGGAYNLHVPAPDVVQRQEEAMLSQDWEHITQVLRYAARDLVGIPEDIEEELVGSVRAFRRGMNWRQRLRETFFASLSALPPLLGVTYTLLTANPVAGSGIWIQLESIFGLNDLWALVSIPASAGLGEQERKQLEQMMTPVFKLWLKQRVSAIIEVYKHTICRPIWQALEAVPSLKDPRFAQVQKALDSLGENT